MAKAHVLSCPNCSTHYAWKPALAGRKAKCRQCGVILRMPTSEDGDLTLADQPAPKPVAPPEPDFSDDGGYELNLDDDSASARPQASSPAPSSAAPGPASNQPAGVPGGDDDYDLALPDDMGGGARDATCPSCGEGMAAQAVICVACGFNVKTGEKLTTQVDAGGKQGKARAKAAKEHDPDDPDAERRIWLRNEVGIPAAMALVGLVFYLVNAFFIDPTVETTGDSLGLLLGYALFTVVQIPCLAIGMAIVITLFDAGFDSIITTAIKVMALAVLTGGTNQVMESGFDIVLEGGGFLAAPIQIGVSFMIFSGICFYLFEFEFIESLVLWLASSLIPAFAFFMIFAMFMAA